MNNTEVKPITVVRTEPSAAVETTGTKQGTLPVKPPVAVISMDDARYFAPPVGEKPQVMMVDDSSAVVPAGVAAVMMTPSNEQTYFPKVECIAIKMDDKKYFAQPVRKPARVPVLMGDHFIDYGDGVIKGINAKGEMYTALKYTIDFVSEVRTYADDGSFSTAFVIHVMTKDGEEKDIEVNAVDYANIDSIIKKELPGAFKHSQANNPSNEYFAEKYNNRGKLPRDVRTLHCGWFEIDGVATYHIGCLPVYKNMVDPYNVDAVPELVIQQGLDFLAVGRDGPEVAIILLFAHTAFLRFWFERQGVDFHSVLYVVGHTGTFKTAVTQVLTNVLDCGGKLSNGIRITSTVASAKEVLKVFRDSLLLIDDYSNNNQGNNAKAKKLRYEVTRYLADDTVEKKMDFSEDGKIAETDFRTVVVFTGEDLMGDGESTELRTVTVEFQEDTVDGRLLEAYQKKNGPMLWYFALFVQFLTEFGRMLESDFYEKFLLYRTEYGERFPGMRRLADTAAQLRLTVDVITAFAAWGSCMDVQRAADIFCQAIDTILAGQADLAKSVAPHERFVRALFEGLAFGEHSSVAGVAESETEYNAFPKAFIGYRDTKDAEEVVCLRFDPAWDLAMQHFKKKGEDFFQKELTVKDALVKNKIILGTPKTTRKKGVYQFRKSKEPRDYMTVFRMDAVNKILNQEV